MSERKIAPPVVDRGGESAVDARVDQVVRMMRLRSSLTCLAFALGATCPTVASAFSGFYVGGADAPMYSDASFTVLMREGNETVLSMANHYDGPLEDFAMVIPVPRILAEDDVKVLPSEVFARLDRLSAPRLVEYWEQDPCPEAQVVEEREAEPVSPSAVDTSTGDDGEADYEPPTGVTVETRFAVGEYDVVILDAEESMGLDRWLRQNGYRIPDGAEGVLRPYVQAGMKFFVAKVDARRVQRVEGRLRLSPLRFHYQSDELELPLRLGLLNSRGTQDLVVVIVARGVRYEAANYDNYAVPTNLDVLESTREAFGAFYATLFDRMTELHPGAVITEYAWNAASCDPCPSSPLTEGELVLLGGDVIPSYRDDVAEGEVPLSFGSDFVLTRLHFRYTSGALTEDLVFRPAPAIVGGTGIPGRSGELDKGVSVGALNGYQGRYVIRHRWDGAIECEAPERGIWGGPPGTDYYASLGPVQAATDTAFALRDGVAFSGFLSEEVPALTTRAGARMLPSGPVPLPPIRSRGGCAGCAIGEAWSSWPGSAGSIVFVLVFLLRRRAR